MDKLTHLRLSLSRPWAFIVTDDHPSPPEAEAAKADRPTCYARPLARSAFLAPPSERTNQPLETARWRMRSGSCAAFGSGSPTRQRERDAERRAALSSGTYTFMSEIEMVQSFSPISTWIEVHMFQLFVLVLIHGTVSAERRQLNHVNSGVKRCCYQQVSFLAIEKDSQKII